MSCDWPIDRACLPEPPNLGDEPTPEEQAAYDLAVAQRSSAEGLAVHVLWALSGRQFGVCEATVRPCPPLGYPRSTSIALWDGTGWATAGCGCVGNCVRSGPSMVHLPGPVATPTDDHPLEVTIAGETLDPAEYVVEGDVLYRRGGKSWPGQNLARPLGESGTWSVTYWRGTPVPPGVDRLTGLLAKEFLAACHGDEKCRLPRNVAQIARQGVTYRYELASVIHAAGKTGLPEVDLWLAAVNPNKLAAGPVVL